MSHQELLQRVVSLCKRRGFVFQSSEIYGGLKSAYDYGPLGTELKRNLANEWWRNVVLSRENVVGLDASIMMHPKVWQASGHLAGFSDPLVDCNNCKERFRADKAPQAEPGSTVEYRQGGRENGDLLSGTVGNQAYICPNCGSCDLSDERQFNLMFRSSIGPVDPIQDVVNDLQERLAQGSLSTKEMRECIEESIRSSSIYLRPETAQAMFVQFLNVQQSMSMKIPFGIAQIGKSFRNEVKAEKFIFRTCEFEQMELEFFCEPGTEAEWMSYWKDQRMSFWRRYANDPDKFRARQHEQDELAHYAADCYDIEYQYPWGWDELEGIASRTDYDLNKHASHSGAKLSYFDQSKKDPQTGKDGWRYTPYVIEPAAGLTRGVLVYLCDAYTEESGVDAQGQQKTRTLMKFHPRLAPIKVAVLPLLKKDGLPEVARNIVDTFFDAGISARYDEQQSIGKRYAKHDEAGTPYCLTIDHTTKEDGAVTIRDRDTTVQERIPLERALETVQERLKAL
jgi:glycyl-tRNA synthetase